MPDIDLETKFPYLRPVSGPPALWSMNGIGLQLRGHRDDDAETGSYVTTHCFCLFSVPLFALRAFRIAQIPTGWLLLGREPLSMFATVWNLLLFSTCLCGTGLFFWNKHVTSPEYMARSKIETAERLVAQGDLPGAADQYRRVLIDHPDYAAAANGALKALLQGSVSQASLATATQVLTIATECHWQPQSSISAADIEECIWGLAEKNAELDPVGTLKFLNTMAPTISQHDRLDTICLPLLDQLVATEPENLDFRSQLATICERRDDLEKCAALLEPFRARLGHSEGARVLGQIESRRGHLEAAIDLLSPYVAERLPRLRTAENTFQNEIRKAQGDVLAEIHQQRAPGHFYRKLQHATLAEQNDLVRAYVESKLQANATIKIAQQRLMAQTGVVPAALELGMLRLSRVQALADQETRRLELEEAEKTFLAIRGVAGESDDFRMNLGIVYYWLNRPAEGKALFDELLNKHERSSEMLIRISSKLYELGAGPESRELAEEAYNRTSEVLFKQQAAVQRALATIDEEDRLSWLKRANQSDPEIKALLNDELGRRAVMEHRDEDAIRHYRKSLEARSHQVENVAMLNNSALICFRLFPLTGDREDFTRGVEMLDRAVKLDPSSGILLMNTASALLGDAFLEIIGDKIDTRILKLTPGFEHLPYLYDGNEGHREFLDRVCTHPGISKALEYLNRASVVSPKRQGIYAVMRLIHLNRRNVEGLRSLRQRIETVQVDLSESERYFAEIYSGQHDERYTKDYASQVERYQELIQTTRNHQAPATFAVAAGNLLKSQMSQSALGVDIDFDELVSLAEEAYAAAPSIATRQWLYISLLFRASHDLTKSQPAYAEMSKRTKRYLGSENLIAAVLSQPGELRAVAAAQPDVRRAVTLIIDEFNRLPYRGTPWDWALLQAVDADNAARLADKIQQDEILASDVAVDNQLSPVNTRTILRRYWTHQLAGQPLEAAELLKQAARDQIPLPWTPPE